jgi:hypothetical protein
MSSLSEHIAEKGRARISRPKPARAQKADKRLSNSMANLMRYAPEALKQQWGTQFEEMATQAFENLLQGASHVCKMCKFDNGPKFACSCDRPNFQALLLYAQIRGIAGPESTIIVNLNQRLGVKDEDELERLLTAGRKLQRLTDDATVGLEECLDDALEIVKLALRHKPEMRDAVLARIG